jgi:acyl-coenzyme A thioesterase PaaI-like protein
VPALNELRAEATIIHAGRRQATAEARLTDRDGRVLATATTTCLILGAA